jgi:hypothetical protein
MQRELESMSIGQLSIEMKKKQASHRKSE